MVAGRSAWAKKHVHPAKLTGDQIKGEKDIVREGRKKRDKGQK
jgi:hypothetical protein